VVDVNHPQAEEQIDAVEAVLDEIGAGQKPTLMVFNKIDLTENGAFGHRLDRYPNAVGASALTRAGFHELRVALGSLLRPVRELVEVSIPYDSYAVISRLRAVGQIEDQHYEDNTARIRARIPPHLKSEFEPYIRPKHP
jgi:GTP-binding protein HflX